MDCTLDALAILALDVVKSVLIKLPDLERSVSRIHSLSCKLKEFILVLYAFYDVSNLINIVKKDHLLSLQSDYLKELFNSIPDMAFAIASFFELFDYKLALEEGVITPNRQADSSYDKLVSAIESVESELSRYLLERKKDLRCSDLVYRDINSASYQLEVPVGISVPSDWVLVTKTKSVNRYWSPFIKSCITQLDEAKELLSNYLSSLFTSYLKRFDSFRPQWIHIIEAISELDCIGSLCQCRVNLGGLACRPSFVDSEHGVLSVKDLYHPCLISNGKVDFVPNDIHLGRPDDPTLLILTGPNMGGKSTLLRQTCLAVLLAQIGSYVPAKECQMSVFDCIYTRIGAHDDIVSGQSTFMVELNETSQILQHATSRSLVILDELGRGTSTLDGFAIAYSVIYYLCQVRCLTLFTTHYRYLTNQFTQHRQVGMYHMACTTDTANKSIIFLYKLVPGICPNSYGMNAASLAGIPVKIVDRAQEIAEKTEQDQIIIFDKDTQQLTSVERLFSVHFALDATSYSDQEQGELLNLLRKMFCN